MTTNLPYENLDWVQNGEPVSGGTAGNSDGVLNRPLVELHANVDAVRDATDGVITEVTNARDGEATLVDKINAIDTAIQNLQNLSTYEDNSALEIAARTVRDRIPSSFDFANYNEMVELDVEPTTARDASTAWTLAVQPLASVTSSFANHAALVGMPKNLYIDGYKIHLDARPEFNASLLVNLGAAPSTGSRLDFAFIEVWKEAIVMDAADSVLFPNGAVNFDKGTATTFNGCTLYTADASGGNYPAYLASAAGHGAYIKANDANISQFLANPMNNVVRGSDGNYYQIRWRLRVVNGVSSYLLSMAHGDTTNVKAQGQLAAPSAITFSAVSTDAGLSAAVDASLALDSIVRAVPVAIVHRRNTTAWSLSNPNGAGSLSGTSGRPDGKFHDHIHFNDVCDLRQHGMFDNAYDYKSIYERNLDKILSCQLMTTFEPLMSDSDGNLTYKDLNIYGTKLLRMDGLIGTVPMDAGWEVITRLKAENGVTCKFDGLRNYFSDVGGDQAVYGMVPAMNADGVNPTTCFTYVASTKTITFDATDFDSGDTNNPSHASRTKVSTRQPHVRWGVKSTTDLRSWSNLSEVAGNWTGLGGESSSFVVSDFTTFRVGTYVTTPGNSPVIVGGDTYITENGVTCTVLESRTDGSLATYFKFYGTTVPTVTGTWTRTSGTGSAAIQIHLFSITSWHGLSFLVSNPNEISTLRAGAVYQAPDSTQIWVLLGYSEGEKVFVANRHPNIPSFYACPPTGTYTKISGTGPATIAVTSIIPYEIGVPHKSVVGGGRGLGSNMMPANAPIHINAYATFAPGSGFLSRIPHNDNNSFIGCHFNVNGTQVLPNNGVGFIPFGSTVDPLNDGNLPVDSHSRTSNLMGFVYKDTVVPTTSYDSWRQYAPCVIKDGLTYKMWYSGSTAASYSGYDILYTTSSDGITWATPQLVIARGSTPGINDLSCWAPWVIKDGSTYKMWYSSGIGSINAYNILYATSSDGIMWSSSTLVLARGTEPNNYDADQASFPCVIKDGSTYKLWYGGLSGTFFRILYSTSSDGITWTTPILSINAGNNPFGLNPSRAYVPRVIKEGSIYKIWFQMYADTAKTYRIGYSQSTDGISWSSTQLVMDTSSMPAGKDLYETYSPCVIKDGVVYKVWFSASPDGGNARLAHAVLTMTDTANTGSSLTGVYSTTGSLNHAPPANSQVVVMYEALADQLDRGMSTTELYIQSDFNCKYLDTQHGELLTSRGTGFTMGYAGALLRGRDFLAGSMVIPVNNSSHFSIFAHKGDNLNDLVENSGHYLYQSIPISTSQYENNVAQTDTMCTAPLIPVAISGTVFYSSAPSAYSYDNSKSGGVLVKGGPLPVWPWYAPYKFSTTASNNATNYLPHLLSVKTRLYFAVGLFFDYGSKPFIPLGRPILK